MTAADDQHDLTGEPTGADRRMYVPHLEGIDAGIKADSSKEYCYQKSHGQDYYHLLIAGEIYIQRGHEKFCVNCAIKAGIITHERMHWQRRTSMMSLPQPAQETIETFDIQPSSAEDHSIES
ncbi:MAG: hypothetical protein ACKVT0_01795 [Planctomycetaceae bacterium]